MKKILKKAVLLVLLVTASLTTKALNKAMIAADGEIKLETFKYVLRNRTTGVILQNSWYVVPTTNQKIYVWAYLPNYLPEIMTEAQINGINVRSFSSVKAGSYRNNGYDAQGYKQPVRPDYGGILVNFNYFCDADGVAIAKTNCANEQDWMQPYTPPVTRIDPYVPPAPKVEMMYVPCANVTVEMEPKDPITGHQASKGGAYMLRNTGVWYYATGVPGEFKKLTCEPVQASSGSVTNNYYSNNYTNNTNSSPNTMNRFYEQQPIQQCCPEPRQRSYTGLAIGLSFVSAFAPMLYQQRRYSPYQDYTPYQPVQWGGTMSNAGSNYDPNAGTMSNAGSSGGISNGGSSNSGGTPSGSWTIVPRVW